MSRKEVLYDWGNERESELSIEVERPIFAAIFTISGVFYWQYSRGSNLRSLSSFFLVVFLLTLCIIWTTMIPS